MSDEERRPLLREDASNGLLENQESNATACHESADGESKDAQSRLSSLLPKLASVVLSFAITGLAQSAIGAMIPEIEAYYGLKNGPTAFIFPSAVIGYLIAVSAIQAIHVRFGRRAIALMGPMIRILGGFTLLFGPPFPVVLGGYCLYGIGTGLTDAGFCAWASSVPYTNVVQGIMHGSWSTGCVLGPQVVAIIQHKGVPWFSFYQLLTILCCLEIIALGLAFRRDDAAAYKSTTGEADKVDISYPLRLKETRMCGLFWFVYVGVESSYGDWIVTYMGRVRHVDHTTAASASSIFWIGMVIGRVVLGPVTEKAGLHTSVATYIVLSTITQAAFKFVDKVSIVLLLLAVVGFFFGPFFPSGIVLLAKKLPVHAHVGAVSVAAAMGQVGGSVCPLIVGFMADAFGIAKLLDVATGLTVVLLLVWIAFCRL